MEWWIKREKQFSIQKVVSSIWKRGETLRIHKNFFYHTNLLLLWLIFLDWFNQFLVCIYILSIYLFIFVLIRLFLFQIEELYSEDDNFIAVEILSFK